MFHIGSAMSGHVFDHDTSHPLLPIKYREKLKEETLRHFEL